MCHALMSSTASTLVASSDTPCLGEPCLEGQLILISRHSLQDSTPACHETAVSLMYVWFNYVCKILLDSYFEIGVPRRDQAGVESHEP
jgi:hypothetical protein